MTIQKNENSQKDFKVEPLWEALRNNWIKFKQERDQLNVELVMPAKTGKVAFVNTCPKNTKILCVPDLLELFMYFNAARFKEWKAWDLWSRGCGFKAARGSPKELKVLIVL